MTSPKINFSPGPSQLYFTTQDHYKQAFREGIPSLSHRSKKFESIFKHTRESLKALLSIPDSHHVFFTSSATEIWERLIQNLVEKKSAHFVNGSFSEKFYSAAVQLNRKAELIEVENGKGFSEPVKVDAELIGVTHNETSTGVMLQKKFIHGLKEVNPHAILTVDAVSSIPYADLDLSKIDSLYFSVQKGFGMPPGLGVWIVNDACIAKSESLLAKGISIGAHHTLPAYLKNAAKNQTTETPNSLGIYVLGKVADDMLRRGLHAIRKETEYKAATLYALLERHSKLEPFVKEKMHRSPTVIVAQTGTHTAQLSDHLTKRGIEAGGGYGNLKGTQLRFANFPAHSKEQFELLADCLESF